jgi:hypothetical protein
MLNSQHLPAISMASEQPSQMSAMGITIEDIDQAIIDGLFHFKKATKLHPVTHAGVTAWGELNATLRAQLISKAIGWDYDHKAGLTLTHNKDLGIAIIATSGDKDTGIHDSEPSTKNKKGPSTRDIVLNNKTLDMFHEIETDGSNVTRLPTSKIDPTETWILLYHIDMARKEVRYELSLPASTAEIRGEEGKLKIDSWKHRIIFEPLPFDQVPASLNTDKNGATEDITFEISKKEQDK